MISEELLIKATQLAELLIPKVTFVQPERAESAQKARNKRVKKAAEVIATWVIDNSKISPEIMYELICQAMKEDGYISDEKEKYTDVVIDGTINVDFLSCLINNKLKGT